MLLPTRGKFLHVLQCSPLWQAVLQCQGRAAFVPFDHEIMRHERESVPLTVSRPSFSVRHPLFHNLWQICGR